MVYVDRKRVKMGKRSFLPDAQILVGEKAERVECSVKCRPQRTHVAHKRTVQPTPWRYSRFSLRLPK